MRSVASPAESTRFGVEIVRVDVAGADALTVANTLASAEGEVIIVRYDARRRDLAAVLAATGRTVLPAGTLTYWERDVRPTADDGLPEDRLDVVSLEELGERGRAAVAEIVRDSFDAYPNHYAVNPALEHNLVAEGFTEWASGRVGDISARVLVLRSSREPVGIATMVIDDEDVEIELAGLVRRAQGRGLYRALLEGCIREARALGKSRVIISTQVDNVRVQRVWARARFVPFGAVETVHLVSGRADIATVASLAREGHTT